MVPAMMVLSKMIECLIEVSLVLLNQALILKNQHMFRNKLKMLHKKIQKQPITPKVQKKQWVKPDKQQKEIK
jgi:hypothetical protein